MTRKDFEALASALASTRPDDPDQYGTWERTVRAISNVCQASNGRFDRGRFQSAIMGRADRLAGGVK